MLAFLLFTAFPSGEAFAKPYITAGDTLVDYIGNAGRRMVNRLLKRFSDKLLGNMENSGPAVDSMSEHIVAGLAVNVMAEERAAQAYIDQKTQLTSIETLAEAATRRSTLPERKNILCHTIAARQVLPVMDEFAEIVSDAIYSGFVVLGRGNGENYGGPQYIRRDRQKNCGINENDPVTGHPVDEPLPECVAPEATADGNPYHVDLRESNISIETLAPERSVLVMPEMVTQNITTSKGDVVAVKYPRAGDNHPEKLNQQLWISARDFCIRSLGPFPTPPYGDAAKTLEGVRRTTVAKRCLSLQLGFLKQCADRVAYISRPDCENPEFASICGATKELCNVALAHNISLPPRYQDCERGLSAYETASINYALCMGSGRYVNSKRSGATTGEGLDKISSSCVMARMSWQSELLEKEKLFLQSLQELKNAKECWEEMK